MQVALGLQYIQDRAAFHGTFHDAACADGIADGINISMGISECFLKLRQNRAVVFGAENHAIRYRWVGRVFCNVILEQRVARIDIYLLGSVQQPVAVRIDDICPSSCIYVRVLCNI